MRSFIRNRATFANVTALLALVVAAGGSAYATATIRSSHIVNDQVKSVDVRDDNLRGGGLVGKDIKEESLGPVPGADTLDGLDSSDFLSATGKADDADKLDGNDSTAFAPAEAEAWHEVGAPGEPALNSGAVDHPEAGQLEEGSGCHWRSHDPALNSAAFFKDSSGVVHLKGVVDAENGTMFGCDDLQEDRRIFTLPPGYRPTKIHILSTIAFNELARITINPDGEVSLDPSPANSWANAKNWLSLDGLAFRTTQ